MSSKRQVVILAGGLGTRLRPITEKVPKPMVPVANKPFLFWQLNDLRRQGYYDVLLLVSYLGEQVEQYFGSGETFGMKISYAFEKEPLGTGGALKNAAAALHDDFFLLNGDSFLRLPMDDMAAAFDGSAASAMISSYDNSEPVPVIPNLRIRDSVVVAYEKDAGAGRGFDRIDSGVYIIKKSLVTSVAQENFMLADLWPPLIAKGKLGAFEVNERFYDIGTIDRLAEFETYIQNSSELKDLI